METTLHCLHGGVDTAISGHHDFGHVMISLRSAYRIKRHQAIATRQAVVDHDQVILHALYRSFEFFQISRFIKLDSNIAFTTQPLDTPAVKATVIQQKRTDQLWRGKVLLRVHVGGACCVPHTVIPSSPVEAMISQKNDQLARLSDKRPPRAKT